MLRPRFLAAAGLAIVIGAACWAAPARAGGGPENVFLVVNTASWASQAVANHYIRLRDIPQINVLGIEWTGPLEGTDGQTFRERILGPALESIERRNLLQQIDYIVYSTDFPFAVDLTNDFPGAKLTDDFRPVLSLNSATYLWHLVFGRSPMAVDRSANKYMRDAKERSVREKVRGFRSWYGWGFGGELIEAGGQPYMLSTMLAFTSGRGNSVREALAYLSTSARADGTFPKGTVYYSKTDDVRSKTRAEGFTAAAEELKKLGVGADIISSAMPGGRDDVLGVMSGVADFSWPRTKSKILPGAICDNFTSFGGILSEGTTQTPLTEFLRYGAAGSSGTVVEPFAIWQKFASPLVHVYYAQGCSLAEAYYQSVFSPAQLLIVGDPLCRPWANIPQVQVAGIKPGAKVSGEVEIRAAARLPKGGTIDRFELYVDGRRMSRIDPGESFKWNSVTESDGYHELRVVAIEQSPIESQGRVVIPITVDNNGLAAQLAVSPSSTARWGDTIKLAVRAPGMTEVLVVCNDRLLTRSAGPEVRIDVNPRQLGLGTVTFQAVALNGKDRKRVTAAPVRLTVEPAKALPALADPPKNLVRGLVLRLADGKTVPVQKTQNPVWLAGEGVGPDQAFALQGFFDIQTEDVYQFQVWHFGELKLTVDGTVLYDNQKGDYAGKYLPVALAPGTHRVTINGRTAGDTRLRILFGGPGATSLDGTRFKHPR